MYSCHYQSQSSNQYLAENFSKNIFKNIKLKNLPSWVILKNYFWDIELNDFDFQEQSSSQILIQEDDFDLNFDLYRKLLNSVDTHA